MSSESARRSHNRRVSRDLAQLLLDDLGRALEHLQANPVTRSLAGPTFHH